MIVDPITLSPDNKTIGDALEVHGEVLISPDPDYSGWSPGWHLTNRDLRFHRRPQLESLRSNDQ